MQARLDQRVAGDPSRHPVWRDDESAMIATRRILAACPRGGAADPHPPRHHARGAGADRGEQGHRHLRGDAPAPDARRRGRLSALGSFAQMNPPIRSAAHRDGLWHWLNQGVPDVIGSDHAPHTREEKAKAYPASPPACRGANAAAA